MIYSIHIQQIVSEGLHFQLKIQSLQFLSNLNFTCSNPFQLLIYIAIVTRVNLMFAHCGVAGKSLEPYTKDSLILFQVHEFLALTFS